MEREVKYRVASTAELNELRRIASLAGFPLTPAGVEEQQNIYYDTPGGELRRQEYALRVRTLGERQILTLKRDRSGSDGLHVREELESDLGAEGLTAGWPAGELGAKLDELLGTGPDLTALFTITTMREKLLVGPLDRPIAELALDTCVLNAGGHTQGFFELEIELLDAQAEQALHAMAAELRERWQLEPEARSKYKRGLALLAEPAPDADASSNGVSEHLAELATQHAADPADALNEQLAELAREHSSEDGLLVVPAKKAGKKRKQELKVSPEDEVAEAARKLLAQQMRKLRKYEKLARQNDDPEGVHQMRVVTRRMRALLAATRGMFKAKALAPFAPMLRELARDLGAVRDRDVFLEHLAAYAAGQSDEARADLDALEGRLRAEQSKAHACLIKLLDSKKFAKAEDALEAFVERPGYGLVPHEARAYEVPAVQVRHRAGSAILSRYEELRAYEAALPAEHVETLHRMRIAGKRLRYTLELFEELLDSARYREVRGRLMELQDHLGLLQDAEVSLEYLHAFAEDQPSQGLEQYIEAREHERSALIEGFPKVWARVNSLTFRRRLCDVITQL
jgi:CHAD domain-containing protein/uncharacterized protein YjbK